VSNFYLIWCTIGQESNFEVFYLGKTEGSGFGSFSMKTGVSGFLNRMVRFYNINMTSNHCFGRNFSTISLIDPILLSLAS
jgi:hypothetical protein